MSLETGEGWRWPQGDMPGDVLGTLGYEEEMMTLSEKVFDWISSTPLEVSIM